MKLDIKTADQLRKAVKQAKHLRVECGNIYFPVSKKDVLVSAERILERCEIEFDTDRSSGAFLWIQGKEIKP